MLQRLSNSFASDIIAVIRQGKIITQQLLLALGLRRIKGQLKVIEIVNSLGHFLTHNTTCEAETAFAVKAQQLLSNSFLPLCPINEYDYVLKEVFWLDNFDMKVEKQTGSTFFNTTHMSAFQERSEISLQEKKGTPLPRSRKRKLEDETNKNQDKFLSIPKQNHQYILENFQTQQKNRYIQFC